MIELLDVSRTVGITVDRTFGTTVCKKLARQFGRKTTMDESFDNYPDMVIVGSTWNVSSLLLSYL